MPSALTTAVRVSVTLLAIAGTAGHLAYLDALWWHSLGLADTVTPDVSSSLVVVFAAHALVSLASAGLAVVLVLHEGRREPAARGLGVAFGAWSYLMAYSGVTMLLRPDPGLTREVFEAHFLAVEVIGLAGLIRFTALFPEPLAPAQVEAPEGLPAVLLPFHLASVWMLRPAAPWLVLFAAVIGLWSLSAATDAPLSDAGLSPLMDVVRLAAAGLVVLNLRRAWGASGEEGRERLQWLIAGFTGLVAALGLMIGGNVLVAVTGFPEPEVAWRPLLLDVGLLGFLGGLATAVVYRGPLRPETVLRRTVTMSTFTTLGLFFAAGLEALLSGGIVTAFSMRAGVGSAIALAMMVSTYRNYARVLERLLPS